MEFEQLMDEVGRVAPSHLRELVASMALVADEMGYSKAAVDKAMQNAMNRNAYDEMRSLIALSEAIYTEENKIRELTSKYEEKIEDALVEPEETSYIYHENIDYDAYRVDESVSYDLYANYTFKRPAAVSYKGKKKNADTWIKVLMWVCENLAIENKKKMESFTTDKTFKGVKRPLFAKDAALLRKPAKIVGTDIYIETNRSAEDIRRTMIKMLYKYEISTDAVQVYLAKDLTALHEENQNSEN